MKLTLVITAICCSLILFTACKKKKEDNGIANSPAGQMLVNGKWMMTASTATLNYMGKDTSVDEYIQMNECDKDDFVTFIKDGNAFMDEGANKCTYDNQVERATWMLLNNDTKIAIADSNPDTMDLEITTAEMKWKMTRPNSSGAPVSYVITFKNIK